MKPRKAKITFKANFARLTGVPSEDVVSVLSADVHGFGPAGIQLLRDEAWFLDTKRNAIVFPAGLVPRVELALRNRGYQVAIDNQADCAWVTKATAPFLKKALGVSGNPQIVTTLTTEGRGQIIVANMEQAADVVATCATLYSKHISLVVAKNNQDLKSIFRHLEERIPGRVKRLTDDSQFQGTVLVVTAWHAEAFHSGLNYPVVIYLGHETPRSKKGLLSHQKDCGRIRYALVAPNLALTPHEQLRVEAVVGRVIFDCRNQEPAAPVKVVWTIAPTPTPRNKGLLNPLDQKQQLIWKNSERNALIAEIATNIAAGNWQELEAAGLGNLFEVGIRRKGIPKKLAIAILVESMQHAKELHALLPSWAILGGDIKAPPQPAERGTRKYIVTESFVRNNTLAVDAAIRVTGGSAKFAFTGVPENGRTRTQFLVDVFDRNELPAARTRLQNYRERGFQIVSTPPELNAQLTAQQLTGLLKSAQAGRDQKE